MQLNRLDCGARIRTAGRPQADTPDTRREVYRGELTALGYQNWGSCLGTTFATIYEDPQLPPPGGGFFYIVTGQTGSATGTMGFATCAERSNYNRCP